jgi:hypothetical protein
MKKMLFLTSLMLSLLFSGNVQSKPKQFFKVRVENVSSVYDYTASGVFNTPKGADGPGPLLPGHMYEFSFHALPGFYVSFATMFVQSNDLFYAPGEMGIPLYNMDGTPTSGDVTDMLYLWDVGSEKNEGPGIGANQAPRQSGANTGEADENNLVRKVDDGYSYPSNDMVLKVSVNSDMAPKFVVTIENVSTDTTVKSMDGQKFPAPLAPGVWVVHQNMGPLFTDGMMDHGMGLEAIAEDGNPAMLADYLAEKTGITSPLAPGTWALHSMGAPFFKDGEIDRGDGLEALAEDGNPGMLHMALSEQDGIAASGSFAVPMGAEGPAPIFPGDAYEFILSTEWGQSLSLATMFVQSNDLFYAPGEMGVDLFKQDGTPMSGYVTNQFMLWDAGTEKNEAPAIGTNQAPRQSGANTGMMDENKLVRMADDGFVYPDVSDVVKITIEPIESHMFYLRITNVSSDTLLLPSDGSKQFAPLAPGVWTVSKQMGTLFNDGHMDMGKGLEHLAEDGDISKLVHDLNHQNGVLNSGGFHTPMGSASPGPLLPGHSYEAVLEAINGTYLSFATMFVPSNDLFYAPDKMGLPLFDEEGKPLAFNATGLISLWDAGTEINEEPGAGPNQPQRQTGPNTGDMDENSMVRIVDDGYMYPTAQEVLQIAVTPAMLQPVTVRIENVSTATTLLAMDGTKHAVPLAPGVWTVHQQHSPLFTSGMLDRMDGLEGIAEDGNPGMLGPHLLGQETAVTSGVFTMPVGSDSPAPIGPGGAYEFEVLAYPGSYLSLATMFVHSNDLFYAPDERGIPLFMENGSMMNGDVTEYFHLWDAGTEMNEAPALGPNQAPRQSGANTGPLDGNMNVRMVDDGYTYPAVSNVIRVILNPSTTSVEKNDNLSAPVDYRLAQNYPNPFNPQTTIQYALSQPGQVRLSIYNINGQRIRELVNSNQSSGAYTAVWDGLNEFGEHATSGMYIYTLETATFKESKRMLLLK